ncbi:hypothetical protein [Ruminococcus bovis]|nr:hypothetical protein [Ruminococcus bovis]
MKKFISILLSTIILSSVFSVCLSVSAMFKLLLKMVVIRSLIIA